jgi:hypothetical protein
VNTVQMRNQIKQYIDQLSPENLEIVTEFVTDLVSQDDEDATEELLKISGFTEAFERGKQQVQAGKVKDWRTVRDDI